MSYFEQQYLEVNHRFLAGSDEVGRGPLAGPVVAATVLCESPSQLFEITTSLLKMGVTDSKKLSSKRRAAILQQLGVDISLICCDKKFDLSLDKNCSLSFCLHQISADCIDQINILNASLLAMTNSLIGAKGATNGLMEQGVFLVDGNRLPKNLPEQLKVEAIVKGDSSSSMIALASILAKEYRDHLMTKMEETYPGYGFRKHAGYGTAEHLRAIALLGPCPIHRKSFKGVKEHCR